VGLVCADPGSADYADYRSDHELWDCESGIFLYLACNMSSPLFSKPELRASLTYSIDRDALVQEFYRNFAHSATLPVSPNSPYYSTSLAADYAYNKDKAAEAVKQAGISGQTLRLLVNKADTLRLRVARKIGSMLSDAGFTVEMLEMSGKNYTNALNAREYDLYLGQTKLSPNMDLSAFFSPKGALRTGGLADAAIYAMCMETLANKGNYLTLHKMVMDDGRLCPILFRSYSVLAARGLLPGLTPSRDNIFYYSLGKTMDGIFVQTS
jgi:peptide/nickel transport system substrate-binding protein